MGRFGWATVPFAAALLAALPPAPPLHAGDGRSPPLRSAPVEGERGIRQRGEASFYADKFQGRETATGETFSQQGMTAASKELPLGTRVKVRNEETGKAVDVRVNDRGPYVEGRVIDLSKKAARRIGLDEEGTAPVTVEAKPSDQPTPEAREAIEDLARKAPPAASPAARPRPPRGSGR